jgi:hypothetical protein
MAEEIFADVNSTELADSMALAMAMSMTGGWGIVTDFWPQLCTGLSLVSSVYVVGSNWLNAVSATTRNPSSTQPGGASGLVCKQHSTVLVAPSALPHRLQ